MSDGPFLLLPIPVPANQRLGFARRSAAKWRCGPVCLEDLVPPDHRVRLVWQFVKGVDISALYDAIKAVEGQAGNPPADRPVRLSGTENRHKATYGSMTR